MSQRTSQLLARPRADAHSSPACTPWRPGSPRAAPAPEPRTTGEPHTFAEHPRPMARPSLAACLGAAPGGRSPGLGPTRGAGGPSIRPPASRAAAGKFRAAALGVCRAARPSQPWARPSLRAGGRSDGVCRSTGSRNIINSPVVRGPHRGRQFPPHRARTARRPDPVPSARPLPGACGNPPRIQLPATGNDHQRRTRPARESS